MKTTPTKRSAKARKMCPICETMGAGPCDECDRLNRPRYPVSRLAEKLAMKHSATRGTATWDWIVYGYTAGFQAAQRRISK